MTRSVERARGCVGARFRLHGRDREHGLDCVGVVAAATGLSAPSGYSLRGGIATTIERALEASGLAREAVARPGAVALVEAGPAQFHLLVLTSEGFIHADAALRRVVERPGNSPWPILSIWTERG